MKTLQEVKAKLLAKPDTAAAYAGQAQEFAIARELITARARTGLTQAEVAQRMDTTQSTVVRMESGRRLPTLRTVQRYAEAVGARAVLRLEADN